MSPRRVAAPGGPAYDQAADLLKSLGNPLRLEILMRLRETPQCVHELVDALGVSQPLVSQHLRVLRSAGLVAAQRRNREVAYVIADDHVIHIVVDALAHAGEGRQVDLPATPFDPDDLHHPNPEEH